MESATFKEAVELIQGGGSIVTVIAVWVAFKARETAADAVRCLHEIRDGINGNPVTGRKGLAQELREQREILEAIEVRHEAVEVRIAAALAK